MQEASTSCPISNLPNATCVYELTKTTTSTQTITTVRSVKGEAAAAVMARAVDFSVSAVSRKEALVSQSQFVTTTEGHYLVIPAGFSFCAYTEGISVEDFHAPSGFTWKCSLTKFVQTPLTLDNPTTCVNLNRCIDGACGLDVDTCSSPPTCSTSQTSDLTIAIIIIICGVIGLAVGCLCFFVIIKNRD